MAGFFDRLLGPGPERRPLDRSTVDKARDLIQDDRQVEAVKFVRERTGMGLVEAKNTVDAIEAGRWVPIAPAPGESLADRARELVAQDRIGDAVSMVRQETGMTEDEAARFVDNLDR